MKGTLCRADPTSTLCPPPSFGPPEARARSLASARVVTQGLSVWNPVIVYNGVFIMEPDTGRVVSSEGFSVVAVPGPASIDPTSLMNDATACAGIALKTMTSVSATANTLLNFILLSPLKISLDCGTLCDAVCLTIYNMH